MNISLKTFLPIVTVSSLMLGACKANTNQREEELKIATENCLKQAELDSIAYRNILNGTIAAQDSDKIAQFNALAYDMKSSFNKIDCMLNEEGISPKEYKMEYFNLADDVDKCKVYQHFADSWMYKNLFKKMGILSDTVEKQCDIVSDVTRPYK